MALTTIIFYACFPIMLIVIAILLFGLHSAHETIAAMKQVIPEGAAANPWKSQLALMLKSDQEVPSVPTVTKTSMLYGALILEESSETLMGLARGMEEVSDGRGSEIYTLARNYVLMALNMSQAAKTFREMLATMEEEPRQIKISRDVAKEILDGVTDIHVVTSGLGIACGLPGQAAHTEVVTSNLSKANPTTGQIDKTPDGKWIKGSNYKEPNIDRLLDPYYGSAQ